MSEIYDQIKRQVTPSHYKLSDYVEAVMTDKTLNRVLNQGGNLADAVIAMSKRIHELESANESLKNKATFQLIFASTQ